MNVHAHISEAEQRRSAAATRARLMGKPAKPKIMAPVLQITAGRKPVDASYHMVLYRAYQANLQATFSMAGSFTVNTVDEYCPYRAEIEFTEQPGAELPSLPTPRKTMKQIVMEVLERFPSVEFEDLQGFKRNRIFVQARHTAMYEVMRQRPDLSYPMVGRFFNKDHTVVLHAVHKIRSEIEGDDKSFEWMKRKRYTQKKYQERLAMEASR